MTDQNNENDYVPEFDCVDLNQYEFKSNIEQLPGRSFIANVSNKFDEEDSFEIALPKFKIGENLDIESAGVNGFLTLELDTTDSDHINFINWTKYLDKWIMSNVVSNHKKWFGHNWNKNGPLYGTPYPTSKVIQNLFKETIDDEYKLNIRVHIDSKDKYKIQCMDEDQNTLKLDEIRNCIAVPLIEINGIFFKEDGYNIDWVVRGIVKLSNDTIDTDNIEYKLFHVDNDEEDAEYQDYATDDDTASEVSMIDEIENMQEFNQNDEDEDEDNENEVENSSIEYEMKLKELMSIAEKAKIEADNAMSAVNSYRASQTL